MQIAKFKCPFLCFRVKKMPVDSQQPSLSPWPEMLQKVATDTRQRYPGRLKYQGTHPGIGSSLYSPLLLGSCVHTPHYSLVHAVTGKDLWGPVCKRSHHSTGTHTHTGRGYWGLMCTPLTTPRYTQSQGRITADLCAQPHLPPWTGTYSQREGPLGTCVHPPPFPH